MSTPSTKGERSREHDDPAFQFTIRTLLVIMLGVGLACTLAPTKWRHGPLPWVLQAFWAVYLMIGFGQAYLCIPWWWRQNTTFASPPPSRFDPAEFIRFGCFLTLPTWGLAVAALFVWKWAGVSVLERAPIIFGSWLVVAFVLQLGGLFVNLKNCGYLFTPLEAASRRLAILNVIHSLIFPVVLCAGGFAELM